MTVQELIDELMKVDIGEILVIIFYMWLTCAFISTVMPNSEEDDVDWSVFMLFPENLIYILKAFWKSIVKAIKS